MSRQRQYNRFQIGEWSYGHPAVLDWGESATLTIGRFCSIGNGVTILLGGEHRTDWTTTYPFSVMLPSARRFSGHPKTRGDVVIGNDVWIGRGALIRSGVKIGDGAVVGAASVVTRSVAPYSVVAGNPCRLIRQRFDTATCEALQRIAWWNWTMEEIEAALPEMLSTDVDAFVARYDVRGPNAAGTNGTRKA